MSLALWLRTGRTERGLSLQDVARVTKIQPRILERLEGGKLEGLPAEVFVRGFIRSYAKCCALDQTEALARYNAASLAQAVATAAGTTPTALSAPPAARAMVEAISDLAPQIARSTRPAIEVPSELAVGSLPEITPPPIEIAVEAAPASQASPKKKRRGARRAKRKSLATGTPSTPTPVVAVEAAPVSEAPVVEPAAEAFVEAIAQTDHLDPAPVDHLDPLVEPTDHEDVIATETWQPKMPPAPTTASVPWRRASYVTTTAASVPTLVIDDADPEHAAQVLEDRQAATSVLTNAQRRSFLPPILLDREDRGARQGGLTLAVIILLIAATLTLSYLMRRPSSSGDGVTLNATETQLVG